METMNCYPIILGNPLGRDNIKQALIDLANKNWTEVLMHGYRTTEYFEYLLNTVYHTLYNDHDLDEEDISDKIGEVFYDEHEAMQVCSFASWLYDLTENEIEEIPREKTSNEAYLNHPDWPRVWSEARRIVKLMEENEKKYNFKKSWDIAMDPNSDM